MRGYGKGANVESTSNNHRRVRIESDRPAVRLCLAADVERYSRFNNLQAVRTQERFVETLRRARRHAGLNESEVYVQNSGDGQFIVLPAGLDESAVIPGLIAGLSIALRQINDDLIEYARLRLRIALHRGLLQSGVNGWVGNSAVAVRRLLDSLPLRTALAECPNASFGLVVSDTIYRDVIARGYLGLSGESFRETTIKIPGKRFIERAWIYIGSHCSL